MKIIFTTHNQGKVEEVRKILKDFDVEILSADEAGVTEDVVEDGKTFEENALKKANFIGERTREWAMADDSGICVKALDGAPGIYSARWAGENTSGEERVRYLLAKMKDVPEGKRDAWFESVAILRAPDGKYWAFSGKVEGSIALEPRGKAHPRLPYDPVFIPKGYNKTFSEMSGEDKNSLSHRGQSFRQLKDFLAKKINS
ncbi:MAG TPA: RdgB/HAM1 family non-canonical purine NTP pyrophosphatase [Candidatus Paceibacterota bacterium]